MRHLVLAALVVACKSHDGEYSGIGHWRFGVSTLKDAASAGNCGALKLKDGRDATWCMGLKQMQVGKQRADVDLYFLGTTKDAPLIEIQLNVRGCEEDEVDRFMRKLFGEPYQTKPGPLREYWKNSFMWMLAQLPDAPAHCAVHFLPTSETAEIERLSNLPGAANAAPPPDAAPVDAAHAERAPTGDRQAAAVANALTAEAGPSGPHPPGADLARQIDDVKETQPPGRLTVASKSGDDADSVMQQIAAKYTLAIRRCYAQALKRDPSTRGRLAVGFSVNATGQTESISASGVNDDLARCTRTAIATWRFAAPKKPPAAVAYTFVLAPD